MSVDFLEQLLECAAGNDIPRQLAVLEAELADYIEHGQATERGVAEREARIAALKEQNV